MRQGRPGACRPAPGPSRSAARSRPGGNEVERDYAYNRTLFKRVLQGWYQFNPQLSVRRKADGGDAWVPIFQALNLALINEFALDFVWSRIDEYLAMSGLPERSVPIAVDRGMTCV